VYLPDPRFIDHKFPLDPAVLKDRMVEAEKHRYVTYPQVQNDADSETLCSEIRKEFKLVRGFPFKFR
jgi:hypothetical protein